MSSRISGYRDEETIQQIVDAARAIEEFCQGVTFDEFTRDLKTQSAIQYTGSGHRRSGVSINRSLPRGYP